MQSQQIRRHYRLLRTQLSEQQQLSNALALAHNIDQFLGKFNNAKIAAYLATAGEISLTPWIDNNPSQRIYLPKLYEPIEPRLRFAELTEQTCWMQNRFNITEPDAHWGNTVHPRQLDIILMPLVAFDRSANRMGMGGGYYDRSLAFRRTRKHWTKPRLIGVAHSLQEHPGLNNNHWDVPLDCIITEREIIRPKNSFEK